MSFDCLPIFVADHLQRIAKQEGFVDGYEVKQENGSKTGDGFMATMLSIKLTGNRRKEPNADPELDRLALICKMIPSNVTRQENFNNIPLFRQEVIMYNEVLPALVAFQKERGVPEAETFSCFPKCYVAEHREGSNESVIIMEDVRAAGFKLWDKSTAMECENVRTLMAQIGRLHGLSFAIRDQNPELFKKFQDLPPSILYFGFSPGITSMLQSSFAQTILLINNPQDLQAMERIAEDWRQIFVDGLDAKLLGKYGVLSHGDCWINNMMFGNTEGSAKLITLLDWQMSRVTSPAIDITYFLFTSTEKTLRDAHLEEFLQIYYTNLARIIRATGSNPEVLFPEEELQRQLRQFGIYGVLMAAIVIPLILSDISEIPDFDDLAEILAEGAEETGPLKNLTDAKREEFHERIGGVLADARRFGAI